ncbi:hypothetical protein [Nocardioides convexus]|uniref:hypothetical protein n=1 Tax=Nocardioides convexus TaxID=2712224 RepID=UPI002418B3ED|nr:hypothetical protein [Nocardioides convexus]
MTWAQTPARGGDSETEEGASVILRCIGKDADAGPLGKPFTGPAVESRAREPTPVSP